MGAVLEFPQGPPRYASAGRRLKRWREQRGVAIETLAAAIHAPPEVIRRVEAGRSRLDSAQLAAATAALHLPLWALVSDTPAY
ncbi:helix-turn-helix domain-containing protein [Brevundimonas sp.]|uniref:helix-turn-helix domain-containing protein n=1 Tax=Brevundimonas sp. TaxID=1871086 RepID=UPI003BAC1AD7